MRLPNPAFSLSSEVPALSGLSFGKVLSIGLGILVVSLFLLF